MTKASEGGQSGVVARLATLTKTYRGGFSLGPIDMDIGPGVSCLVGANGAGKTTLFKLIAGTERPSSGTVEFPSGCRADTVGYLPQEIEFPGTARCDDFLYYVAWVRKVPPQQQTHAVARALSAVELQDRAAARIRKLSGGMRRRLGIAQVLVPNPSLVLLDEPTAGLDPKQRALARGTIAGLGAKRSVFVSTHLVEDVRSLATRVIVLDQGRIVFSGSIDELEARSDTSAPGDTPLERAVSALLKVEL